MNSLFMIAPYQDCDCWVFDDARVGLSKEPFVLGVDVMLDRLTADIPNAKEGFCLIFSPRPFPGYKARLNWEREEMGGNWYRWEEAGLEGWLCPALNLYFPQAPKEIYVKPEPRPGR